MAHTNQLHVTENKGENKDKTKKTSSFYILQRRKRPMTFHHFSFCELVQQNDATFDKGNLYRSVLLIKPFCASYAFIE